MILSRPGVSLVSADKLLPVITVKLDGPTALVAIQGLSVIDYIEPVRSEGTLHQAVGCQYKLWGELAVPFSLEEMTMPGSFPDVLPWNFAEHQIPQAWARGATGAGIKIAVIDTGVYQKQTQLQRPVFSSPQALGVDRTVSNLFTAGGDPWDECGHGTRMAATIAAPHDGKNIVGVAWKADLVTIKTLPGVWVTAFSVNDVARAIRTAVSDYGAKIVAMAFGDAFASRRIADEISYQYHLKDVLFFVAAGTIICPEDFVAFPARMEEVIAVAGMEANGNVHPISCAGPEVDLAAVIGEAPTAGEVPEDIIHFGGSSNATAIAAGVAALVWSDHKGWSRDEVRERMFRTADHGRAGLGWGRINAYRAVGGFHAITVMGPRAVSPNQSYRLIANPLGDGPDWTYQWKQEGGSVTATTPHLDAVSGAEGSSQSWTVEVTDRREGKSLSQSVVVTVPTGAYEQCLERCDAKFKVCKTELERELGRVSARCPNRLHLCKQDCGSPTISAFRAVSIIGPSTVAPSKSYRLTAKPEGGGPDFTYGWKENGSTAATTAYLDAVSGAEGSTQSWTVEVTDTRAGKTLSQSVAVRSQTPPAHPPAACASGKKCCDWDGGRCRQCIPQNNHCP
ncbi:S8 family peptidase [Bradyrhizobium australiense]|uniref:S8 family serine peptidase n=1 Tax=Bradyrhizobium australiense TaxID=2721161 RepID=A0A7Y4GQ94_9BRAD|nr:S8 family serine peptidase [Bradyrhizobium australiense]NOJ39984.1 S8 family serine peptidase [Bradyrhizobium australiense]